MYPHCTICVAPRSGANQQQQGKKDIRSNTEAMRLGSSFISGAVLLHASGFSGGFRVSSTASLDRRRFDALQTSVMGMSASREPQATAPAVTRSTAIRRVLAGLSVGVVSTIVRPGASGALESDEFEEVFDDIAIGIELEDVKYKGSSRVLVKRVVPGSAASRRSRIKADFVLVSANGADLERQSAVAAKKIIKTSPRPLTLVFRDTSIFQQLLKPEKAPSSSLSTSTSEAPPSPVEGGRTAGDVAVADGGFEPISTRVSPEGVGREEQVLRVLSRSKSQGCEFCGQGARKGDLLEIEYSAKLENGTVFDGSNIQVNGREVVGRAGDKTLYFVLGKQPKGQFPPGWDLLLMGMCVGESRVISVPPLLGYGAQGMPRRGVPPNATLLYDVRLIGVNGVNMCVA